MEFTAEQIAQLINGRIIGDPNAKVSGFSSIEDAKSLSLSFIARSEFLPLLANTQASIVIISEDLVQPPNCKTTIILVKDAYLATQILMNIYHESKIKKTGIEALAFIHDTAKIGENCYIGAFAYIDAHVIIGENTQIQPQVFIGKNAKIGKNCKIDSGVKIYEDCLIEDNCVIHANTVIGGDGFGFQRLENQLVKIPQLGNVHIEAYVEIGSNCSIDRATLGSTKIKKGTKIDNLIQIAHNVVLGENNVIAAQTGIAGSTTIGDWNMIGGQVGIVGHIEIGNEVRVQAQSGINKNVKDKEVLYGSPAFNYSDYNKSYVMFKKLPELSRLVYKLEQKIQQLDVSND